VNKVVRKLTTTFLSVVKLNFEPCHRIRNQWVLYFCDQDTGTSYSSNSTGETGWYSRTVSDPFYRSVPLKTTVKAHKKVSHAPCIFFLRERWEYWSRLQSTVSTRKLQDCTHNPNWLKTSNQYLYILAHSLKKAASQKNCGYHLILLLEIKLK